MFLAALHGTTRQIYFTCRDHFPSFSSHSVAVSLKSALDMNHVSNARIQLYAKINSARRNSRHVAFGYARTRVG